MSRSLYLLDTNTVGYLLSGRSPGARRRYNQVESEADLAISVITEAEVRYGYEHKPTATRLRRQIDTFLESIEILPWDSAAAHTYAKLRVHLQSSGCGLAVMDMLIAAHAIAAGAVLVTSDKALHRLAPVVKVVDWATDLAARSPRDKRS